MVGLTLVVVSAATADGSMSLSPVVGGDLVVFVGNVGVFDVDPATGAAHRVFNGNDASSISFSRDGTRMLYLSAGTPVVADGDGRNAEHLLTDGPMGDATLSPDGTRIAFIRDGALFVRGLRDSGPSRQLTAPTGGATDNYPSWAPTGDRILVGRWWPVGTALEIVYAGGGEQEWAHNGAGLRYPEDGTWSPDGSRFATLEAGGVDNGGYHLTIWDVDGGNPRPVTPNRARPVLYRPPIWSPDGQTLAFADWEPDRVDLVGADGTNLRTIYAGGGEIASLTWRPHGSGVTVGLNPADTPVARRPLHVSGVMRSIGSDAATDVTLTISTTNGTITRASLNGSPCVAGHSIATCTLGSIAGDTDTSLLATVKPSKPGRLTIGVSATAANDAQHDDDTTGLATTVSSCTVLGTAQDDRLIARGHDIVCGLDGDDLIRARNGKRDVIDGGPGSDTAIVDRIDVVRHVEHVKRPQR